MMKGLPRQKEIGNDSDGGMAAALKNAACSMQPWHY
jgi:hypothetical protein